jgi:prephenate dehydrogenase
MKPTVAIIGLGLVGGSLARALARKRYRVIGVDRRAAALRQARRSRLFALTTSSLGHAIARADLVVLAATPSANLVLLRRLARAAVRNRKPLFVTDVSSVKRRICALGALLSGVEFVGGHPMAGRERSGFAASRAELFRGRPWVLAPGASRRAQRLVRRIVRDAGARPVVVAPAEHDRAVAFLSHLPQLVAWALRDAVARDPVAGRRSALAGPAFADMTRIARSPRRLWRQILDANRGEVARALRAFRAALAAAL